MWRLAVVAAAMVGAPPGLRADAGRSDRAVLARWIRDVDAALAAAAQARAPVRTPPVAVAVVWQPKRLASLDLGAPLLALVGSDLDGDRKAELYAITEREVVALDVEPKKVTERARAPLPAEPPAIKPRDAVATACFEHPGADHELRVRASTGARGARYGWAGSALTELGAATDFPVCTGKTLALVPGRNHFGSVDAPIYDVRCRNDLVDRDGTPLGVVAELGAGGQLAVTISPRCPGCAPSPGPAAVYPAPTTIAIPAVGTAYAAADLDRDGTVEIIAAGAGPPGEKDAVKVLIATEAGVKKKQPVFRRGFQGGVVAIVAADIDGDGADEVIAAVRLSGTAKVDLWQLNK